jgi:hypothetical protein
MLKTVVSLITRRLVALNADRIEDPIARLRFLQRVQTGTGQPRVKWQMAALGIALVCMLIPGYKASNPRDRMALPVGHAGMDVFTDVWLVDKTQDFETYSNGLRIDNRHAVSNQPRLFYPVFQRGAINPSEPEWRTQPAGIVYHTTESDQARFESDQTGKLKRIGKEVLSFVAQNHCYHFLIDRFGQVFRVVQESDAANHAGFSVWADDNVIYVNLNSSFFGIAFETQTQKGQDLPSASPAQVHAARVLTQMLRSKYHIPAANCVTHAQVSVNPNNMLVGYHTDWSGNFPFREVGINDNYSAAPASIYAFGFDYDPSFVHATGVRIWEGLALAEDQMRADAAARGLPVPQYRSMLQKKYKEIITTLKASSAAKENSHET